MNVTADSTLILAIDGAETKTGKNGKTSTSYRRGYFACTGADYLAGKQNFISLGHQEGNLKTILASAEDVLVVLYPTRTYSSGFGGSLFTDIAPEDRVLIRKIQRSNPKNLSYFKVPLNGTGLFDSIKDYFGHETESKKYRDEQKTYQISDDVKLDKKRRFPIGFDTKFLVNVKDIFASCMTRPNKQDFFYLATKTFGVNMIVRVLFAAKGVQKGDLPIDRAIYSSIWYQLQDVVFTVFGQTYMKFLGRMTGMFRILNAYIGDFLFVYVQFCFFEFLNRLILGPIGENPLVYTWAGLGLILLNNLQGLISGGPLVPAINKIRRSGCISHSTMMHLYQVGSLCFYFGLFASFGYQKIYALLTGSVLAFSWGSYVLFSLLFKDPKFEKTEDAAANRRLDQLAVSCYVSLRTPENERTVAAPAGTVIS